MANTYGPQKLAGPKDPYEMIVFLNCGYPASDAKCAKGFEALKREIGVEPQKVLAVSKPKLAKVMQPTVIRPAVCAERLKEIALKVKRDLRGDLATALKQRLQEAKDPGKGPRGAKKVLQEFPVIGEPSAEKILLFSGLAWVAAVPSALVDVPMRIFVGEPGKNYAADYRAAREILDSELPETFCKRSKPKCEVCPLTAQCAYLQAKAADANTA